MQKRLWVMLMVVALLFGVVIASEAYTNSITGQTKVSCEGDPDSSDNCPIETDTSRYVSFPGGSLLTKVERTTTSDTLTTAECGKTIFVDIGSGNAVFTLPASTGYGCSFTFVALNGNAVSGQGRIIVDVNDDDTFIGCVNSSAPTTFASGDSIRSAEATGDSLTVVDYIENRWGCPYRVGTWTDNN